VLHCALIYSFATLVSRPRGFSTSSLPSTLRLYLSCSILFLCWTGHCSTLFLFGPLSGARQASWCTLLISCNCYAQARAQCQNPSTVLKCVHGFCAGWAMFQRSLFPNCDSRQGQQKYDILGDLFDQLSVSLSQFRICQRTKQYPNIDITSNHH
jgi:hypothetical protein